MVFYIFLFSTDSCNSYEFTCDNGDCTDKHNECNGVRDCGDGSDERNCPSRRCNDNEVFGFSYLHLLELLFISTLSYDFCYDFVHQEPINYVRGIVFTNYILCNLSPGLMNFYLQYFLKLCHGQTLSYITIEKHLTTSFLSFRLTHCDE